MKKYGIIYKILNLLNGKIYIGQTIFSAEYRWNAHCSNKTGTCKHLYRAILKYKKESFEVIEIDSADSKEELDYMEKYWIKFYDSTNYEKGYNISIGGKGPQFTRQNKIERAKYFIKCIESGEIFVSTVDAARVKGITRAGITRCLTKKSMTAGGLHWEIINKNNVDNNSIIHCDRMINDIKKTNVRGVRCIETGEIFESTTKAATSLGLKVPSFYAIIRDKKKYNELSYEFIGKKVYNGKLRKSICKKILCLENNRIYNSVGDAAKDLNTNGSYISYIIRECDGKFKKLGKTLRFIN